MTHYQILASGTPAEEETLTKLYDGQLRGTSERWPYGPSLRLLEKFIGLRSKCASL